MFSLDCMTIISGNLTRDPESRTLSNGNTVCNFTVAVNVGYGERRVTKYFRVAAWNTERSKQADLCQKYLKKGASVMVEGQIDAGAYIKDGKAVGTLELLANTIKFVTSGGEGRGNGTAAEAKTPAEETDEIPF